MNEKGVWCLRWVLLVYHVASNALDINQYYTPICPITLQGKGEEYKSKKFWFFFQISNEPDGDMRCLYLCFQGATCSLMPLPTSCDIPTATHTTSPVRCSISSPSPTRRPFKSRSQGNVTPYWFWRIFNLLMQKSVSFLWGISSRFSLVSVCFCNKGYR